MSSTTFANVDQSVSRIIELTVTTIEFKRLLHQADTGTGVFKDSTLKQRYQFKTNIRQRIEECERSIEEATKVAISM